MSTAINPELNELRGRVETQGREIAELRATKQELKRTSSDTTRQTIWQFVIFTVTMVIAVAGSVIGTSVFQTEALRREMNARFDGVEQRFQGLEKRIEQSERNLAARFEDLKQEVRAGRK
jgi:hypothetical protein